MSWIRKSVVTIICAAIIVCCTFSSSVKADTVNYGVPPMDDYNEYPLFKGGNYYRWVRRTPNQPSEGYLIVLRPGGGATARLYLFNDSNFATIDYGSQTLANYPNGAISWSTYYFSSNHNYDSVHTYNGVTFYGHYINGFGIDTEIAPCYVANMPSTEEEWYNVYQVAMTQSNPIDTGSILNLSLSTRYVTEQKNNSSENLDVITWDGRQDSNLNDLTGLEWFVDIRARKISYSGNSTTDLLSRTQNEAVFTDDYFNIASVSAKKGNYELTWGDVYDLMDISAYQILPSESLFYTFGWVYQMRLRNADTEDVSEWQTVYTLSSLPPQDTQDFSNNLGFNAQATEIIYKVDTQNLNNNSTYVVTYNYYNDIPISSDDYQQDVNGKPWYAILLEGILGLLQSIVDAIAGVASDIVNGLFNFVTTLGVNLVDFFSNIFDNLRTGFSDIDLDLPMWEIDFDFDDPANQTIINLPTYIITRMFNSGLGYMILIPLVLFLVRMFF